MSDDHESIKRKILNLCAAYYKAHGKEATRINLPRTDENSLMIENIWKEKTWDINRYGLRAVLGKDAILFGKKIIWDAEELTVEYREEDSEFLTDLMHTYEQNGM
jgi:hypothetical protein